MRIENVEIGKLNPAAYNPRKDLQPNDIEYIKLSKSIESFGYIEPIVWNTRTGNVVGGHQRLKILRDQGQKTVECVVVDYDEDTEKAANLALNKISGDWEFSKLADLLLELDTANFDLGLTGFDADEVQKIMEWTPANCVDALAAAISAEEEYQEATITAQDLAERVTETLSELAAKDPARLNRASAVIVSPNKGKAAIIIDPGLDDVLLELTRYAEAGEPSPLLALMGNHHSMVA